MADLLALSVALALLVPAPAGASAPQAELSLRVEAPPGQPDLVTVVVAGLSEATLAGLRVRDLQARDWEQVLVVAVAEPGKEIGKQTLFGEHTLDGSAILFRPRFPISPGLVVFARLDGSALDQLAGTEGSPDLAASLTVPHLDRAPVARVDAISPPAQEVWPENLLRFYLHFAAPMSPIDLAQSLQLVDLGTGATVPEPFVAVEGGLWDPSRRRATVLVHPGRVKRGVGPRVALGGVFEAGRRYQLHLPAGAASDADGVGLVTDWTAEIVAGPPDHTGPDPRRWERRAPRHPEDVLEVRLDEPADRALLARLLAVEDSLGRLLEGEVSVDPTGHFWHFRPAGSWAARAYALVISSELEDACGNQVDRRFEEPLTGGAAEDPTSRRIEFRARD